MQVVSGYRFRNGKGESDVLKIEMETTKGFVNKEDCFMAYQSIDNASKITVYKQITDISCAATCAGMCVKKSPATLQAAGFNIDNCAWDAIAQKYGYHGFMLGRSSLSGVLDVLLGGMAAVAKIVDGDLPHWVVVTAFAGDNQSLSASQFTCADPWTGKVVKLDKATRYSGIYTVRYLY